MFRKTPDTIGGFCYLKPGFQDAYLKMKKRIFPFVCGFELPYN